MKSELVLQCFHLNETMKWFVDQLFFRVDQLSPADDPSSIVLSGNDLHIRLERCSSLDQVSKVGIRLVIDDDQRWTFSEETKEMSSPDGLRVELIRKESQVLLPPFDSRLEISRLGKQQGEEEWIVGRVGMKYRDLIPQRQGGRFIASHIRIEDGQAIKDSVHYHYVLFQLIYVYRGWVRVLYEDQGDSFVLHEGDCVFQPPGIRHRVLESSDQLEVVEIASPASHQTHFDHQMKLPGEKIHLDREYQGQTFLKYLAEEDQRPWQSWRIPPFQSREIGMDPSTKGLISFTKIRLPPQFDIQRSSPILRYQHDAGFVFLFILHGYLTLEVNGEKIDRLEEAHSIVLPADHSYSFIDYSHDLQMFQLSLPAHFSTIVQ